MQAKRDWPGKLAFNFRLSIVNFNGHTLLDTYIRPEDRVTDFLSFVSGVTPSRIKEAPTLKIIWPKVEELLKGKIIVGHSLHHDLSVYYS